MDQLSSISKLLVPIITTKFFGLPKPGAVKKNGSLGTDSKIEKRLLLFKVKRSSCVCFCATQELSVQHKLVGTSTFDKQGFRFRWK